MSETLEKKYDVVSFFYGVKGLIIDNGDEIKLFFTYKGKEIEIALSRPFPCDEKALYKMGMKEMDLYVNNYLMEERKNRKLQLHYWYVDELPYGDKMVSTAHGIVSGHEGIEDTTFTDTSEVKEIFVDKENAQAIIRTRNSEYHCPLEYCNWNEQDKSSELIPEYEWIKENYKDKINEPSIEEDKVLLVLSNFDEYYFNSLYYKPAGAAEKMPFRGTPHIGMFQDSYLIHCEGTSVYIKYFPHYQNIEFYSVDTENKAFFVENIGDITLYVRSTRGLICLGPGERKEVCEANAEKDEPFLPKGDLYPAVFIDR